MGIRLLWRSPGNYPPPPAGATVLGTTPPPAPPAPPPGSQTVLRQLDVGADILDENFLLASRSASQIATLALPTGGSSSSPFVRYRYNFAGQIAERIDARGCAFRYSYDGLGRLSRVQVGFYPRELLIGLDARPDPQQFVPEYPEGMSPLSGSPTDRTLAVEYEYDDAGHLHIVRALGKGESTIAETRFEVDARGSLLTEFQAIGDSSTFPETPPSRQLDWRRGRGHHRPTPADGSRLVRPLLHRQSRWQRYVVGPPGRHRHR